MFTIAVIMKTQFCWTQPTVEKLAPFSIFVSFKKVHKTSQIKLSDSRETETESCFFVPASFYQSEITGYFKTLSFAKLNDDNVYEINNE